MYFQKKPKVKHALVISLSSGAVFLVAWFFILSFTLLNPSFYHFVFSSKPAQAVFTNVSSRISADGTTLFSSQSLKDNAYSLVEGILRLIRQKDMSLSNINFETENTPSIPSTMMAAAPGEATAVPEISRIHPFVIAYFMPGSESIFTTLLSVQKAFTALNTIIPALGVIALLLLCLHDKTADNSKAVFRVAGVSVMLTGVVLLLFYRPLLLTYLSALIPDADIITPIVRQIAVCLMVFAVITGALLVLAAAALSLTAVKQIINRFSKAFALTVLVFTCITVIVFSNDVFDNLVQSFKSQAVPTHVNTLKAEDGTVHSLTIKLREANTQDPIENVRLTLFRMDSLSETSQTTVLSDVQGEARFIVPEGNYLLFADPTTVSGISSRFEPVTLCLDKPDSSWYTFYLQNNGEKSINRDIPNDRNSVFPNHPVPLLK